MAFGGVLKTGGGHSRPAALTEGKKSEKVAKKEQDGVRSALKHIFGWDTNSKENTTLKTLIESKKKFTVEKDLDNYIVKMGGVSYTVNVKEKAAGSLGKDIRVISSYYESRSNAAVGGSAAAGGSSDVRDRVLISRSLVGYQPGGTGGGARLRLVAAAAGTGPAFGPLTIQGLLEHAQTNNRHVPLPNYKIKLDDPKCTHLKTRILKLREVAGRNPYIERGNPWDVPKMQANFERGFELDGTHFKRGGNTMTVTSNGRHTYDVSLRVATEYSDSRVARSWVLSTDRSRGHQIAKQTAMRATVPITSEWKGSARGYVNLDRPIASEIVWACWPSSRNGEYSSIKPYKEAVKSSLRVMAKVQNPDEYLAILVPVAFMKDRGSTPEGKAFRAAFLEAVNEFSESKNVKYLVHGVNAGEEGCLSSEHCVIAPEGTDAIKNSETLKANGHKCAVMVTGDPNGRIGNGGLGNNARSAFDEGLARQAPAFCSIFSGMPTPSGGAGSVPRPVASSMDLPPKLAAIWNSLTEAPRIRAFPGGKWMSISAVGGQANALEALQKLVNPRVTLVINRDNPDEFAVTKSQFPSFIAISESIKSAFASSPHPLEPGGSTSI